MKVLLSLRKFATGRKIITEKQNKRRKDPVINMLRHTNNAFAAKYPVLHSLSKPVTFGEGFATLIGLFQIPMPNFSRKSAQAFNRYRGL